MVDVNRGLLLWVRARIVDQIWVQQYTDILPPGRAAQGLDL